MGPQVDCGVDRCGAGSADFENSFAVGVARSWSASATPQRHTIASYWWNSGVQAREPAFSGSPDCPPWPNRPTSVLLEDRKGQPISRIEPLVSKLTNSEIAQLEGRFSGSSG
jgi:hypothetical protein